MFKNEAGQRGVEFALPVEALVEWVVPLVAFGQLEGWDPLARLGLTLNGVYARHVHVGSGEDAAVWITGGSLGINLDGGRPLLAHRQQSGRGWRRQVQVEE